MDVLIVYTYNAMPSLIFGSPLPASVCRPLMKSVGSEDGGRGKGVHSACWGSSATLGFRDRKQFSMLGEGRGV